MSPLRTGKCPLCELLWWQARIQNGDSSFTSVEERHGYAEGLLCRTLHWCLEVRTCPETPMQGDFWTKKTMVPKNTVELHLWTLMPLNIFHFWHCNVVAMRLDASSSMACRTFPATATPYRTYQTSTLMLGNAFIKGKSVQEMWSVAVWLFSSGFIAFAQKQKSEKWDELGFSPKGLLLICEQKHDK